MGSAGSDIPCFLHKSCGMSTVGLSHSVLQFVDCVVRKVGQQEWTEVLFDTEVVM